MLRATAEDRESLASGAKPWYVVWWRRCFGKLDRLTSVLRPLVTSPIWSTTLNTTMVLATCRQYQMLMSGMHHAAAEEQINQIDRRVAKASRGCAGCEEGVGGRIGLA